ncbi:glucan endo-1,6-beta-glucosidase [Elizabethkingia meningoseptica]|uniref:Glucan endo-1,6-beta-glucosidase n=1 Tax=Elizabethkingia meningoseptica TaxID=238 RepID=A0A1V3TVM4_ELIME|nr:MULTISPECIES: glycoside hydrolase family 30 beta sandwich domain-containing protein [Elizabethkingia]AQX12038.1 glucan endo-1,6-beta-glucosidase [Elizabethkingia meningoseptica]MBG0513502.1 glucan endo-1,6-beta-glucosidase [Elizabethkingia meningoseptica]MDE5434857.1 glucan endo-1,6-beta-glucosidase [Elizabethkingia meningoseptica]MDE5447952.1 glucan endo-1,6-beta-glucosidase [Elizabethkingia meningoseptica]MDE5472336.1 glucan endo-1,6-beta-glucosidase [Elizabethkingia meningoseptica]
MKNRIKTENFILKSAALAGAALFFMSCSGTKSLAQAELWQSKGDKTVSLQKVEITAPNSNQDIVAVNISPDTKYQEILGVGASLTHSSADVLFNNISAEKRKEVLEDLFTKKGIGIDYLRLNIGASDFSPGNFSLNDTPGDVEMKNFNFATDEKYFLPVLSDIVKINPDLHLMGSPWSPPSWMKTNNSMVGGELKKEFYPAMANYLSTYVKEMAKKGFRISALTIQNEPLYDKAVYPCMLMTAEMQRDFIKDNLGPKFKKENIKTHIISYDHNWDHPDYGITILKDPEAAKYVEGTAFHAYAGKVDAMSEVHKEFPDKGIFFTEQSGGGWAPNYSDNLSWNVGTLIIDGMRNWTKNVLLWNLALDEKDGPTNKGCLNCRGVITVTSDGKIKKNEEYYSLGHVGKFLQQGAKRIESNDTTSEGIKNIGFINPDGKIVVVMTNFSGKNKNVKLNWKKHSMDVELQDQSVYTLVLPQK